MERRSVGRREKGKGRRGKGEGNIHCIRNRDLLLVLVSLLIG